MPTTTWIPGQILTDRYTLALDPDTEPGTYHLEVGFYDPDDRSADLADVGRARQRRIDDDQSNGLR